MGVVTVANGCVYKMVVEVEVESKWIIHNHIESVFKNQRSMWTERLVQKQRTLQN
jgi:hypothetical protein